MFFPVNFWLKVMQKLKLTKGNQRKKFLKFKIFLSVYFQNSTETSSLWLSLVYLKSPKHVFSHYYTFRIKIYVTGKIKHLQVNNICPPPSPSQTIISCWEQSWPYFPSKLYSFLKHSLVILKMNNSFKIIIIYKKNHSWPVAVAIVVSTAAT